MLSQLIQLSADQLENPILQSPLLGDRLVTLGRRTDETEIRLEPHYLSICNYSQNSLETYYTEKLGRIAPEQQTYMPEYYLAANFRFIFSSFLPNFSAALLHSSGVIRNGKAALFLAPDNGGKSTVIGLSEDDPVLSGDHVILRKEEGVFIAHGTPLGGMTSGPLRAEVGALFMLEKASCFRLDPISARELLYSLWNEHRNYTFFLPKRLRKQAFQLLSEACYNIPRFRMRFSKNFVDWNAIDRVMGKGKTH